MRRDFTLHFRSDLKWPQSLPYHVVFLSLQKGTLSLSIQYSDGMMSSLADINSADFQLHSWSRNEDELVFVSKSRRIFEKDNLGPVPHFLMIQELTGGVPLEIELLLPENCQKSEKSPILHSSAFVETSFLETEEQLIQTRAVASPAATPVMNVEEGVRETGRLQQLHALL